MALLTAFRILPYVCVFLGGFFLLATNPSTMLIQLASVSAEHRPFSFAIGMLIRNGCGYVPGPIVVGALDDILSPVQPDGSRSILGLEETILLCTATLVCSVSTGHKSSQWTHSLHVL